MATTIAVSEETRERLVKLKLAEGARSVDEVLGRMLASYRKARFAEASDLFRRKLGESGLRFEDLVE